MKKMNKNFNAMPFELRGKWSYRIRSLLYLYWSLIYVSFRRLIKGPRLPKWNWAFEVSTYFAKIQSVIAFDMPNIMDGRAYEDSLIFTSAAVAKTQIETVSEPVKGQWFTPNSGTRDVTMLYLHGGGYAFYSKSHENLIALVAGAAGAKTFAPDYRLIPEHPFPAQLEDALAAYRWLLETGVKPERLVVCGDSAGGNLTLALLLALRDSKSPLPTLGICIAPWTDVGNSGDSLKGNEPYDWVEKRMTLKWAEWFCKDADPHYPIISPINADLRGLPPIYIQAGDAEILYDMIQSFSDKAQAQGANVKLDVWQNMNHDFQAFGDIIPESNEALQRIGQVISEIVHSR
jgi:acetyl esterase/lipase